MTVVVPFPDDRRYGREIEYEYRLKTSCSRAVREQENQLK